MRRFAVTFILAGMLLGCETLPKKMSPGEPLPQRCAVVAMMNTVAILKHTGITVFGNERIEVDVKALRFAERLEQRVTSTLSPRLTSVKVVDLGTRSDIRYLEADFDSIPATYMERYERFLNRRKQIEELAVQQGHDCLLTIAAEPTMLHEQEIARGLGLLSRGQAVSVFSGTLTLITLPEGKVLARRWAATSSGSQEVATVSLDSASWRNPERPFAKVLQDKAVQDFKDSLDRLAEVVARNAVEMLPTP